MEVTLKWDPVDELRWGGVGWGRGEAQRKERASWEEGTVCGKPVSRRSLENLRNSESED